MADNRVKRDSETREKEVQKRSWVRPESLPSPSPEPGYAFRWIRVGTRGETDAKNVSSKFREGWQPVKASDHPEIIMMTVENDQFKDNIVIGNLLLCKAPEEVMHQRAAFYNQQASSQMTAVDNNLMRENDPRMPIFNDRKSTVTFGEG